jgi:uncharacterized protein
VKTLFLTGLGFLFLGLGAIGVFLPVWPTTPFVLVSVACFSSSPRIKQQIMSIQLIRDYVNHYEHRRQIPLKTVWLSIGWLWGMLSLSVVMVGDRWIQLALVLIGVGVTAHIAWITRKKADPS